MVVMEKCCCCSVRTACLIFGSLALIGSIIQVGNDGKEIIGHLHKSHDQSEAEVRELYDLSAYTFGVDSSKDEIRNFFEIGFYFSITDLILSIGMIVAAGCVIYGVRREKDNFLFPALVIWPFDFLVRFIFVFVHSFNLGFFHPISLLMNVALCFGIVFDIFIWLCVYSHWQQLKDQAGPEGQSYNAVSKV